MRRSIGFFSDESKGYRFSGITIPAQPLTKELGDILRRVNRDLKVDFNAILINVYDGKDDYISPHSDDETALAKGRVVAAISFGENRIFRITDITTKKKVKDIVTENGQMLVMAGNFQKEYHHSVPKGGTRGKRISYTFRRHTK